MVMAVSRPLKLNTKMVGTKMTEKDNRTIYAKLVDARKAFYELDVKKSGYNEYSNYYYYELSDILVPACKVLSDNDLMAVMSFETEIATMTVHDFVTGDSFVITSPMSTATLTACQPVQSMGACQSFVRRYCYIALVEIVESDKDLLENASGKPEPMATDEQIGYLQSLNDEQIPPRRLAWLGHGDNFETMTEAAAESIIGECKELNKEAK
jgi:hypothetical protein